MHDNHIVQYVIIAVPGLQLCARPTVWPTNKLLQKYARIHIDVSQHTMSFSITAFELGTNYNMNRDILEITTSITQLLRRAFQKLHMNIN